MIFSSQSKDKVPVISLHKIFHKVKPETCPWFSSVSSDQVRHYVYVAIVTRRATPPYSRFLSSLAPSKPGGQTSAIASASVGGRCFYFRLCGFLLLFGSDLVHSLFHGTLVLFVLAWNCGERIKAKSYSTLHTSENDSKLPTQ